MSAKVSMAVLTSGALLVALALVGLCSAETTIDQVRDEIWDQLQGSRAELKEYAKSLLTGSAAAVVAGKESCLAHSIRQLAVGAEALRSLAKRKNLATAHHIISMRFDPTSAKSMRESLRRQGEPVERYVLLSRRATLRAYTDGSRFAQVLLNLLYLTINDNYNVVKSDKVARAAAEDAFERARKHENAMAKAYKSQVDALNDWVKRGLYLKRSGRVERPDNVMDIIDAAIDQAYFNSNPKVRDESLYNTYPGISPKFVRFWLGTEMEKAVGFNFTVCNGVREFSQSEVLAVKKDQFTSLMLKMRKETQT